MTTISRLRVLLACCFLGALIAVPIASASPAPGNATKPSKVAPSGSVVAIVGKMHLDSTDGPTVLIDKGTVTGTPYGAGTAEFIYTLHPKSSTATVAITITTATGTITAQALTSYTSKTVTITFSGAAVITGGTGAYADATSGVLEFNALHNLITLNVGVQLLGSTKSVATKGQRSAMVQQLLASINK
ncbi:MAG: hypothetical protein ACR2J9_04900 [Gaiellales bacterium]